MGIHLYPLCLLGGVSGPVDIAVNCSGRVVSSFTFLYVPDTASVELMIPRTVSVEVNTSLKLYLANVPSNLNKDEISLSITSNDGIVSVPSISSEISYYLRFDLDLKLEYVE